MFNLTTTYNFDSSSETWRFPTEKDASDKLKEQFREELRIQTEENRRIIGKDLIMEKPENEEDIWTYASITTLSTLPSGETDKAVMCWNVSEVRDDAGLGSRISVSEIIDAINGMELTADECSSILRALENQKTVFAGKLWTDEDIENTLAEEFGLTDVNIKKDWIEDVRSVLVNSKKHVFTDMFDEERNALREAAKESGVTIHVSNIEWDADDEEDIEDLYTEKDIPLAELEDFESVSDFLTEDGKNCVKGFCCESDPVGGNA